MQVLVDQIARVRCGFRVLLIALFLTSPASADTFAATGTVESTIAHPGITGIPAYGTPVAIRFTFDPGKATPILTRPNLAILDFEATGFTAQMGSAMFALGATANSPSGLMLTQMWQSGQPTLWTQRFIFPGTSGVTAPFGFASGGRISTLTITSTFLLGVDEIVPVVGIAALLDPRKAIRTEFGWSTSGRDGTSAMSSGVLSISPSNAVPEPATWAMMIAGFALCGAAMRQRGRVLTPA